MIADVLIAAVFAPILLVTAYFALELLVGLKPLEGSGPIEACPSANAVIVIPAHDEQSVIERTVRQLGAFPVLVVADNCSDDTASLAKQAGAYVIERNDDGRRGKGFALAAARDHLGIEPPEIVIVVDADCHISDASLYALASAARRSGRACQAANLLSPDLSAPPLVQISSFAFMIKNLVRQRSLSRLADYARLTGTGMALPWRSFSRSNLGASNIVEDLALGLDLSKRSAPPIFVEEAVIWSPPASLAGTLVQRSRWEGGYIHTALNTAPGALLRSIRRADVKGFLAALDLCIPPLALLALLNLSLLIVSVASWVLWHVGWPLILQLGVTAVVLGALAEVWACEGRRFASGATLLRLPLYVLWKLPMYLRFVRRGAPKDWLRTGRN